MQTIYSKITGFVVYDDCPGPELCTRPGLLPGCVIDSIYMPYVGF